MKLIDFKKCRNGKFLKNYELTYENKVGNEKVFEIVSLSDMHSPEELGAKANGISIVAICDEKLLLLHEFRPAANKRIYNLCAGFINPGESVEECIRRELYEESGLEVVSIKKILPPSFAAVGLSDVTNYIAFVEAKGELSDHTTENEDIIAGLYTKEEVAGLLSSDEMFSSRCQIMSYFFTQGLLKGMESCAL